MQRAWVPLAKPLMVTYLTLPEAVSRRRGASLRYYAPGKLCRNRMNKERERLLAHLPGSAGWKHWGPYLSERQWGTVREDYSANGCAWDYFPHEHARSRVYRWGEDGLAGVSDAHQ